MLFNHKFTSKLEIPGRSAALDKHWSLILGQLSVSVHPDGGSQGPYGEQAERSLTIGPCCFVQLFASQLDYALICKINLQILSCFGLVAPGHFFLQAESRNLK